MNDIFLAFEVNGLKLERADRKQIPSTNRNFVQALFKFTTDWDNLSAIALFSKVGLLEPIRVPIANGICQIPNELLTSPGIINVLVFAGDKKVTNLSSNINVIESGFKDGVPPADIEPTVDYVMTSDSKIMFIREFEGEFQYFSEGQWKTIKASGGTGGEGLEIDNKTLKFANGVLQVNTTNEMKENNIQPITSHGVALQVGNINALLEVI